MSQPVLQTSWEKYPVRRGKVRDIYDLGDRLLMISTDRISAFDWVLPSGIPDKGRVLPCTIETPTSAICIRVPTFKRPSTATCCAEKAAIHTVAIKDSPLNPLILAPPPTFRLNFHSLQARKF